MEPRCSSVVIEQLRSDLVSDCRGEGLEQDRILCHPMDGIGIGGGRKDIRHEGRRDAQVLPVHRPSRLVESDSHARSMGSGSGDKPARAKQ